MVPLQFFLTAAFRFLHRDLNCSYKDFPSSVFLRPWMLHASLVRTRWSCCRRTCSVVRRPLGAVSAVRPGVSRCAQGRLRGSPAHGGDLHTCCARPRKTLPRRFPVPVRAQAIADLLDVEETQTPLGLFVCLAQTVGILGKALDSDLQKR